MNTKNYSPKIRPISPAILIRKEANDFITKYKQKGYKVTIKHFRYIIGQGNKLIHVTKFLKDGRNEDGSFSNPDFIYMAYDEEGKPLYRNNGGQTRISIDKEGEHHEAVSNCIRNDQYFSSQGILNCFKKIEKEINR